MPQMSPMPWILILIFTFISLFIIINYIFFLKNNINKINNKINYPLKIIKW